MPMTFLRAGETGMIQRVGGAEDTKRFLANLGFVDGAAVTVISELNGNLIVNIKDSRVAINKEMAKHVMVQQQFALSSREVQTGKNGQLWMMKVQVGDFPLCFFPNG